MIHKNIIIIKRIIITYKEFSFLVIISLLTVQPNPTEMFWKTTHSVFSNILFLRKISFLNFLGKFFEIFPLFFSHFLLYNELE